MQGANPDEEILIKTAIASFHELIERTQEIIARRSSGLRESEVHDQLIAYHGTGQRIEQFQDNTVTPHFFTQDKEYALAWAMSANDRIRSRLGRSDPATIC